MKASTVNFFKERFLSCKFMVQYVYLYINTDIYIYIHLCIYIYIYYFNVIPYITIARSLFLDVACQIFFYGREGNKSLYYLPQTRKSDEWHSSGEHERREDLPDYRREQ